MDSNPDVKVTRGQIATSLAIFSAILLKLSDTLIATEWFDMLWDFCWIYVCIRLVLWLYPKVKNFWERSKEDSNTVVYQQPVKPATNMDVDSTSNDSQMFQHSSDSFDATKTFKKTTDQS